MITAQLDEIIGLLGGEIPKDNLITSKLDSIIAAKGGSPTESNLIGAKLRYIAELFNANTDSSLKGEVVASIIAALGGECNSKLLSDQLNVLCDLLDNYEAASVSISYLFDNDICGNASGDIVLLANNSDGVGDYDIMWGDASGIMANYSAINGTLIAVTEDTSATYAHLIDVNAIPKYATRVCAVQDGEIKASFTIPESKRFASGSWGSHLYSIEVLSDVHYQYESGSDDWNRAFTFGRDRESIQAICISGDFCDAGQQSHLNVWKNARDSVRGTTPVYGCNGNHEEYGSNNLMVTDRTAIRPYLDSDFTGANGDPWFTKTIGGDLYVFVPIFEGVVAANSAVMFSDACLEWLEDVLEENRNRRVFLFAHVPPSAKYTANGFGIANYAYSLDLWGGKGSNTAMADRLAFLELMAHYKNVIWFNGHSHIKYQYQEQFSGLNYFRYNTDGARLVHVSSLTVPRDIVDGTVTDYIYAESEGFIMDVYDNCVILRGRNFVDEKYLGIASFLLDTRPVTIDAKPEPVPDDPEVTLSSISATKTTTTYNVGDTVATDDVVVTAHYSDGTSAVVSGATFSNVSTASAGTKTMTVTYEGKTTTISIVVNEVVVPDTPSEPTVPSLITTKGTGSYLQMNVNADPTHYFTLYFVDSAAVISHSSSAGYDVWTSTKQCKYYVFESTDSGQTWQNNSGDSGHTIYTSGNVKPTSTCYFGGDYKSDAITLLNGGAFTKL